MRPKILSLYLFRHNLFLFTSILLGGVGVYLLIDVFERLDNFIEAKLGVGVVLLYFGAKIPLIISQIMPPAFLIAMVVQLCLMARSRELLALNTGGISLSHINIFFMSYAVLWCFLALIFSQYIGIYGERLSTSLWERQVQGKVLDKKVLHNVWYTEGNYIIQFTSLHPFSGKASGVFIHEIDPQKKVLQRIIQAEEAVGKPGNWQLKSIAVVSPDGYSLKKKKSMDFSLQLNPRTFLEYNEKKEVPALSMGELSDYIKRLEQSGSNVEQLRTAWHTKWAHAFSMLAVGLIALSLLSFTENLYINIALSLVITFLYYVLSTFGVGLAQKGILSPWLGAWLSNIVFYLLTIGRLFFVGLQKE